MKKTKLKKKQRKQPKSIISKNYLEPRMIRCYQNLNLKDKPVKNQCEVGKKIKQFTNKKWLEKKCSPSYWRWNKHCTAKQYSKMDMISFCVCLCLFTFKQNRNKKKHSKEPNFWLFASIHCCPLAAAFTAKTKPSQAKQKWLRLCFKTVKTDYEFVNERKKMCARHKNYKKACV